MTFSTRDRESTFGARPEGKRDVRAGAAPRRPLPAPLGDVAVVGPGRAGSVLGRALRAAGVPVAGVVGRDDGLARELGVPRLDLDAAARAAVVLLAVPDGAVAAVAAEVPWRAEQVAVHVSGALSLDVLAAAAARGARVAAFHPLQTVASRTADPAILRGCVAGIEADDGLFEPLAELARRLGMSPVRLTAAQKVPYHLAAVVASNFLVTLWTMAAAILRAAGVEETAAAGMLGPLMAQTLANVTAAGGGALTGPIARGDTDTIQRHLRWLAVDEGRAAVGDFYRAMGAATAALARDRGAVDRAAFERIVEVLGTEQWRA